MNVDEIQTFLAIIELGGVTRAAERLHRSQPAISRRLDMLEEELGAPLFERLNGHIQLTEAGRAFLPHAEAVMASLRDGRQAVHGLQSGLRGTISLAIVGTLADTHIVDVLRRFADHYKNSRLELRTASSQQVTNLVLRGESMLGLRYYSTDHGDLSCFGAGSEKMIVVTAPGHRLAGRRLREARLLVGERWVGFPPAVGEHGSGQLLARQLVRANLEGADVLFIDSLTAQKRMAQAGFGLALVPESSVRDEIRKGVLVTLDVPLMSTTVPVFVIHRRKGYLSAGAKMLLHLLINHCD
jgi:DNA-binding transcriptional LysR family regulator